MFRYLPEQASDFAERVDFIHNVITDISVFFTVAIVGTMLYFAFKYRARGGVNHETPRILGSHALELVWTIVPTIICIYVAVYGYLGYRKIREVPTGAIEINVTARQWKWEFEYPNGRKATTDFYVPVNQPIKLIMHSTDVLHSFFIPSMRVKNDTLPNKYTYLWFRPIKTGVYQAYCTEYCGLEHWNMLTKLHVVSEAEYQRWLTDNSEEMAASRMNPVELGGKLYNEKGCNACHSLDGTPRVGPSLLKVFGKKEKLSDNTEVVVDENYIKDSLLNPNAQIVAGFPPNMMPSFTGQLDDQQIGALISFIKAQDGSKPVEAPKPASSSAAAAVVAEKPVSEMTAVEYGQKVYNEKLCVTCHTIDGSPLVGPTFKGIYGRQGKLTDGTSYTADDAYIKDSIMNPAAQVVAGFPPAMPAMGGQLGDKEIAALIEYMKTLK